MSTCLSLREEFIRDVVTEVLDEKEDYRQERSGPRPQDRNSGVFIA